MAHIQSPAVKSSIAVTTQEILVIEC